MKTASLLTFTASLLLTAACSKSDHGPTPDGGKGTDAPGVIYIKQGREGITRFDLATGIVTEVIPHWLDIGWDISWDGTLGVKQVDVDSYNTDYIIFSTVDGHTVREVHYEPYDDAGTPEISPDGTMLALQPMFNDGLIILDMDGNVLHNISGYGDHRTWLGHHWARPTASRTPAPC